MDEKVGLSPVSRLSGALLIVFWSAESHRSLRVHLMHITPSPHLALASRWVLALRSAHTSPVHEVTLLPPPYASCLTQPLELCAWVRGLSPTKHTWARNAYTHGVAACESVQRMGMSNIVVWNLDVSVWQDNIIFLNNFVLGTIRVSRGISILWVSRGRDGNLMAQTNQWACVPSGNPCANWTQYHKSSAVTSLWQPLVRIIM